MSNEQILTYKEASKLLKIPYSRFINYVSRSEFSKYRVFTKRAIKCKRNGIKYKVHRSISAIIINDTTEQYFNELNNNRKEK